MGSILALNVTSIARIVVNVYSTKFTFLIQNCVRYLMYSFYNLDISKSTYCHMRLYTEDDIVEG